MQFFIFAVALASVCYGYPPESQAPQEAGSGFIAILEPKFEEGSGIEVIEVQEPRHKRDISTVETTTETAADELTTAATESAVTEPTRCESLKSCYSDNECGAGGKCLGAFVGTCNCNTCLSFLPCKDDSQCGGFNKACNTATGICDCYAAYALNGFKDSFDGMTRMCNVEKCTKDNATDVCFGLPCNAGSCFC